MSIHLAIRALARRPGLTVATIAMLAIGIGANTAIYSIVYHSILQPIPAQHPERLVWVWKTRENLGFSIIPNWEELAEFKQASQLKAVEAYRSKELTTVLGEQPEFVVANQVMSGFFGFVNVVPHLGRPILESDTQPGAPPVVLLSHQYWQSRFGGSGDVLGKSLDLSGQRHEIVGVMPFGFRYPNQSADLWIPLVIDPSSPPDGLNVLAELNPQTSLEQAKAELDGILAGMSVGGEERWTATLLTWGDMLGRRTQNALWLLFAAVGLVLAIACANAANLSLIRAISRSGEMSIRSALGARRGHLVSRLLLESTLLGLAGGVAGILLAVWGLDWIRAFRPENLEELSGVRVDQPILIFSFLLSFLTGLVFGLIPAMKTSRPDLAQALRSITSGHTPSRQGRLRALLVTLEMALCTLLLLGAGLLIRSFSELQSADPGYKPEGLLSVRLSLPMDRYSTVELRQDFFRRAAQLYAEMPGVEAVTLGLGLPSRMGVSGGSLEIEGHPPVSSPPGFAGTYSAANYFRLTGIPMLAGRTFEEGEDENAIIVNREMAERYFGSESAVGQRIRFGPQDDWTTIVGVVENVRAFGLADSKSRLQLYHPFQEIDPRSATLILRVSGQPAAVATQVSGWMASLDDRLPIREVASAEQLLSGTIARERFSTFLFSLFAAIGVVLAVVGLYGVVSFLVQQRTREIGIRMALGARRVQILRMVLLNGVALACGGIVLGLLGSYWFNQAVTSQLVSVRAIDPVAAVAALILLFAMVAAAALLPASRASRTNPNQALRTE